MPGAHKQPLDPSGADWISLAEGARRLGESKLKTAMRALRGQLRHQAVGRNVYVCATDVDQLARQVRRAAA